jgi:predicted GNAT family acetyltransferase
MARDAGESKAFLFTSEENIQAQHAYTALGFRPIGDYGIILFRG